MLNYRPKYLYANGMNSEFFVCIWPPSELRMYLTHCKILADTQNIWWRFSSINLLLFFSSENIFNSVSLIRWPCFADFALILASNKENKMCNCYNDTSFIVPLCDFNYSVYILESNRSYQSRVFIKIAFCYKYLNNRFDATVPCFRSFWWATIAFCMFVFLRFSHYHCKLSFDLDHFYFWMKNIYRSFREVFQILCMLWRINWSKKFNEILRF